MVSAARVHHYQALLSWTATADSDTRSYRTYSRTHQLIIPGKPPIALSADPAFRGDRSHLNPEECLITALSSCHMLTYLSLASQHGLLVRRYEDEATGEMIEEGHGGRFVRVDLHPVVTLAPDQDQSLANQLHGQAHRDCYIANSVNFPVAHHAKSMTDTD